MTRPLSLAGLASLLLLLARPALAQTDAGVGDTSRDAGSSEETTDGSPSGSSSSGSDTSSSSGTSGSGTTSSSATSSSSGSGTTSTASSSGGTPAASTVRTYEGRPVVVVPAPAEEDEEPEEEGDGRDVDFLWIEVEGGIAQVDLIAFSGASAFEGTEPDGSSYVSSVESIGGYVSAGVGFRVYWLAIGARANLAFHNPFQLGWVGGDATLRLPVPVVEPYIRAGFAYAWQGNATYSINNPGEAPRVQNTTVYGWAFESAIGFDIYLANWITIGGGVGLDLLNMTRQSNPTGECMGLTDFCPRNAGDALGYQIRGFGQVSFRF